MSDDGTQRILVVLGRLETKVDGLETKVDGLGTKVDGLEARLDRADGRQDKMRADIMHRIDRLRHKVDQTYDDMIVNFGNTDRVERVARAAADETRTTSEILRVMQRQIMRLQTDVEQLKPPP